MKKTFLNQEKPSDRWYDSMLEFSTFVLINPFREQFIKAKESTIYKNISIFTPSFHKLSNKISQLLNIDGNTSKPKKRIDFPKNPLSISLLHPNFDFSIYDDFRFKSINKDYFRRLMIYADIIQTYEEGMLFRSQHKYKKFTGGYYGI